MIGTGATSAAMTLASTACRLRPLPPHVVLTLADGRLLGFREFGDPDGRPVVACHGAPATSLLYEFADDAARRHGLRLIVPTRPGYAVSTAHDGRTLADSISDVRQLLQGIGVDGAFATIGISGGGPYAVALAAAFPQRCTALRLVSPVGILRDLPRDKFVDWLQARFFLDLPRRRRILKYVTPVAHWAYLKIPQLEHWLFQQAMPAVDRHITQRPHLKLALDAMTNEALAGSFDGALSDLKIYSAAWPVDLSAIRANSKLWQGTADTIVPPEAAFALATRIAGCDLYRIDGAGHFWIYDHIDDVLRTLAET